MNWQPIDTAPDDGTPVLLCRSESPDGKPLTDFSKGFYLMVGSQDEDGWSIFQNGWLSRAQNTYHELYRLPFEPTHWAELPEFPR